MIYRATTRSTYSLAIDLFKNKNVRYNAEDVFLSAVTLEMIGRSVVGENSHERRAYFGLLYCEASHGVRRLKSLGLQLKITRVREERRSFKERLSLVSSADGISTNF